MSLAEKTGFEDNPQSTAPENGHQSAGPAPDRTEARIKLESLPHYKSILGVRDIQKRLIERFFSVRLQLKDDLLLIQPKAPPVDTAGVAPMETVTKLIYALNGLYGEGMSFAETEFEFMLEMVRDNPGLDLVEFFSKKVKVHLAGSQLQERIGGPASAGVPGYAQSGQGGTGQAATQKNGDSWRQVKTHVVPKSITQREYIYAIENYDMVFGIGPAGTGKTYLAMACGIAALLDRRYDRIILTRPAVEAGESLGYLPGDLYEKINPYLRPLYDAMYDMVGVERGRKFVEQGLIEIAPLAYMRGRTLNNAFIILDEAQNTTEEQMKMLLTRLGMNSRTVVTGDVTQVDLPERKKSGLIAAQEILRGIDGIKFVSFSGRDVVRHRLVRDIIAAYERGAS